MSISVTKLILILLIVLLIFGANKLPNIMGDVAKGIKSFKDNLKDGKDSDLATQQIVQNTQISDAEKTANTDKVN